MGGNETLAAGDSPRRLPCPTRAERDVRCRHVDLFTYSLHTRRNPARARLGCCGCCAVTTVTYGEPNVQNQNRVGCSVFQRTVSMRAGSPARGFADSGLNCNVRRNRVPGVSKSIFDAHGARGEMCTADSHYERNDVAPPNSLVVHQSKSMTTRRGLRRACSRYDHELFGRAPCTAWPISGVSASQYAAP